MPGPVLSVRNTLTNKSQALPEVVHQICGKVSSKPESTMKCDMRCKKPENRKHQRGALSSDGQGLENLPGGGVAAVMEGVWTSAGGCWGEDILNRKKARQVKRGGMRTQTPVKWG